LSKIAKIKHSENQLIAKLVINEIYFVGENIRKKNRNNAANGRKCRKIRAKKVKKVAYIYCNPKKMLTFASLLAQ
jgi:hypothetical protein